jgi:hypothetical protein
MRRLDPAPDALKQAGGRCVPNAWYPKNLALGGKSNGLVREPIQADELGVMSDRAHRPDAKRSPAVERSGFEFQT